jgi:hypothetical protein
MPYKRIDRSYLTASGQVLEPRNAYQKNDYSGSLIMLLEAIEIVR